MKSNTEQIVYKKIRRNKLIKTIPIFVLVIILLSISVISIELKSTPEAEIQFETTGFFWPLLKGFYEVEDWEVAVCMHSVFQKNEKAIEDLSSTSVDGVSGYGGMVNNVNGFVDIGVADPNNIDNVDAKTNLYTICWVITPNVDSVNYEIVIQNDNANEKVISGKAYENVGAADCKTIYSDKRYDEVQLGYEGIVMPANWIIERSVNGGSGSLTQVNWD